MKEYLAQQVRGGDPVAARHIVREILQAKALACLQRTGAMIPLAFHGGTSLRFLYSIDRFSEDLHFALERPDRGYDFRVYLRAVRADFEREGYNVTVKANDRKVVHSAFLRFRGLLHELGLSPHRTETLAIKVEVDTRPPAGAVQGANSGLGATQPGQKGRNLDPTGPVPPLQGGADGPSVNPGLTSRRRGSAPQPGLYDSDPAGPRRDLGS